MITSDQQLTVTQRKIRELETYVEDSRRELSGDALALALAGTGDLLDELRAEVDGYLAPKAGNRHVKEPV